MRKVRTVDPDQDSNVIAVPTGSWIPVVQLVASENNQCVTPTEYVVHTDLFYITDST